MSETNKIIEEIKQIKEQYQAEVGSERKAWPNAIKDRVSKLYALGMNGKAISVAIDISYYSVLEWRPEGLPDSRGRKAASHFHSLPVVKKTKIGTVTIPTLSPDHKVEMVTVTTPDGYQICLPEHKAVSFLSQLREM